STSELSVPPIVMLFFFLMGTISFAYILGNLGIMLRQRNMFLPALLFVCLMGISTKIEKHNKLNNKKLGNGTQTLSAK
ncbi:MAG: hypothetical protein ACPG7E_08400, partial [Marinirhabdus sp.]